MRTALDADRAGSARAPRGPAHSPRARVRTARPLARALVRGERAALQQGSSQLDEQREAGRLGLGSLVDHGASIGCLEVHGLPLWA